MLLEADVVALARSPEALERARALALAPWIEPRRSDRAAWGEVRGRTGRTYRVAAAFSPPRTTCTCERGASCEHGLGLLLLVVERREALAREAEPAWLAAWVDAPRKARRAREPAAREREAAKRAEARASRMADGLDRLEAWLVERAEAGVARLAEDGARSFDAASRRLVDAQLPGLAGRVRAAGARIGAGDGWADEVALALGELALLTAAFRRERELPPGLARDVRAAVGLPTREADVLASGERVRDAWLVVGVHLTEDERLATRRTWLLGGTSRRWALLLDFQPPGADFRAGLAPADVVTAELAFHPSAAPLRAIVVERSEARPLRKAPPAEDFAALLERWTATLERNPFATRLAALLDASPRLDPPSLAEGDRSLPVAEGDLLRLLALTGGGPARVACEWNGRSLRLLGAYDGPTWIALDGGATHARHPPVPTRLRDRLLAGVHEGHALPVAPGLSELVAAQTNGAARALLLVGIEGVAQRAGVLPARAATLVCAPDEDRPPAPTAAAPILRELLESGPMEIAGEALGLLVAGRLLLPPAVLPTALDTEDDGLRARLRPVLGERGRWLARAEPRWSWASAPQALPSDADVRFDAADHGERLALFRAARAERPDLARTWLSRALLVDPAERRRALVETMAIRLAPEDEPVLQAARSDRSAHVRAAAVELLLRVPESALARGASERLARFVRVREGSLDVKLPGPAFDARWAESGVREEPPRGWGKRAWWLAQMLAAVRPTHLAHALGHGEEELPVAFAAREHAAPLLDGLARGALRFHELAAAPTLLAAWAKEPWAGALVPDPEIALVPRLGEPLRTERALAIVEADPGSDRTLLLLASLPRPFAPALADFLVHLVARGARPELAALAALGLPPSRLAVRLGGAGRSAADRTRARFDATLDLRGRLHAALRYHPPEA